MLLGEAHDEVDAAGPIVSQDSCRRRAATYHAVAVTARSPTTSSVADRIGIGLDMNRCTAKSAAVSQAAGAEGSAGETKDREDDRG